MTILLDRAQVIHENFLAFVKNQHFPEPKSKTTHYQVSIAPNALVDLVETQMLSRHLDLMARELKQKNLGYYTIGSSGHEGNAVLGSYFRVSDMALLHYRSGGFFIARAKKAKQQDYLFEQLLSLVASTDDPIASGRHKVFGSLSLNIPPQTSTIASHLPKAVGLAVSITRARELKIKSHLPSDGVILCGFGDASCHHSTAQGAFNAAQWIAFNHYPLPLIFICEDNGIGISVSTPINWIESAFSTRPHIHYIACDGLNICDVYRAAQEAEVIARDHKKPVFLHIRTVRLMGHAGSDIETHYLSEKEIEQNEFHDPLLHAARYLLEHRILTSNDIIELYLKAGESVKQETQRALLRPKFNSAEEVMSSLIPKPKKEDDKVLPTQQERERLFGETFSQLKQPRNLAQLINFALTDLMIQYDNILVFGEDVAKKGGVYRVTADLMKRFGQRRVFNSILDEQTILGHAIGFAMNGFIPIPEIQFLAYLHNAEDQLRGEAATLSFFSNGQYTNPMVIRIAGLAYQKGFGGHFHNDNSIAVLRDIPSLIIACPSNGEDAVKMLRTCVELAYREQRIVVFLEPIALYMTKDLHKPGDNQWLGVYPAVTDKIAQGEMGIFGEGRDCLIISYGNGYYLSRQAKKILSDQHQIETTVVDLRWLKPLNIEPIKPIIAKVKSILIVDETRKTGGGIAEELHVLLHQNGFHHLKIASLTAKDCFIPIGAAWQYILPSCEDVVAGVLDLIRS